MGTSNQFLEENSVRSNKILFAASEAQPLMKTGGLADVAGSLPLALHQLGLDVRLILPAYPTSVEQLIPLHTVISSLKVPGWGGQVRILAGTLHGELPVYLVDIPGLFDRIGNPYLDPQGHNWRDNADRFAAFCRVVVAMALKQTPLEWHPDVVHCNDWQTGLVPALLSAHWDRPATLFTIHNLAYQGLFDRGTFQRLRLPPELWNHHALEFHQQLSFIKGGIAFADRVTTVSPTYSSEILTPELGYGLEGLLRHRLPHLSGILNGIDYRQWDPRSDPHIASHYSAETLHLKAANKQALQQELGLAVDPEALLFGHIGRLVPQKGSDLIIEILDALLHGDRMQLVLLGSGDEQYEQALSQAALRNPQQIASRIGYDEALAHRIEAASDAFLMPSRFEPCGLNQLYSLRYGTPPIVHRTGGLADTVINASSDHILAADATGFVFEPATSSALWEAMQRAETLFRRPSVWWEHLARNGMQQDFSWQRSAVAYRELYLQAVDDPLPNPLVKP